MQGPLVALQGGGTARWSPRNYRAFAREGMMQNAVVFRCVRLIAEAAASVPLRLAHSDSNAPPSMSDAPTLLDLMQHPAPGQTMTDLLEAWFGYLVVSGNAYAEAVTVDGHIAGLNILRPDRVRVVTDASGWVSGHDYTVGDRTVRLAGEAAPGLARVLHLKLFHPDDDHYGLSPIEAAASAIDIHNGASRWNKALLDNAARPSGALVYSASEQMTGEQFARLKDELEASFQGAANAGRPLLLEGGLTWRSMSMTPRDMDFIAAKDAAAREIALALGVPPMLLGIPGDNTYANYQEANRTFWRQTIIPLVNRTARAF
ncbi:MAG: phage portal protein, partial [Pseudomonadota bacterium]